MEAIAENTVASAAVFNLYCQPVGWFNINLAFILKLLVFDPINYHYMHIQCD
jgi:hypothetical protein